MWSSPDPGPSCRSQDGAAWSYLKGGDAPAVEHYEPAAVPAAQYPVIFREGRDPPVYDLVRLASILFVGNVQVLAANEADAQHDLCHGHVPRPLLVASKTGAAPRPRAESGSDQRWY